MLDVAIVAGSLSLWLPREREEEKKYLNRLWMWDCHYSRLTVALTAERGASTGLECKCHCSRLTERCLNRLWMWCLLVYNDESLCRVFSSFRANFDIKNRATLTSNLMTLVQHAAATNHRIFLTRRRNETSPRSWRFWPAMHNRKKKKKRKESTYRDFRPRTRTNKTWHVISRGGAGLQCDEDMHCRLLSMSFTSLMTMDAFNNVRINIETSHMNVSWLGLKA